MRHEWIIEDHDIDRIRQLLREMSNDPFVVTRVKRNLADDKPPITEPAIWRAMVMARITSRQRSGPGTPVSRFLRTDPFPLSLDRCRHAGDLRDFIEEVITHAKGVRFAPTIARDLADCFQQLDHGLWEPTLAHIEALRTPHDAGAERVVANHLADHFKGIGPKQSRNLLQSLGLTLHEIPIDSRIAKWLNRFGFPVRLSSDALSNRHYYEFISDGIQALCQACGVVPCVLDAAIFASYDKGKWTSTNLVF